MSIVIVLVCLLVSFLLGITAGKAANVLNAGKAIMVGVLTGAVLAGIAFIALGGFAAIAALVGGIAGSLAYGMLTALQIGGC